MDDELIILISVLYYFKTYYRSEEAWLECLEQSDVAHAAEFVEQIGRSHLFTVFRVNMAPWKVENVVQSPDHAVDVNSDRGTCAFRLDETSNGRV